MISGALSEKNQTVEATREVKGVFVFTWKKRRLYCFTLGHY